MLIQPICSQLLLRLSQCTLCLEARICKRFVDLVLRISLMVGLFLLEIIVCRCELVDLATQLIFLRSALCVLAMSGKSLISGFPF